MTILINLSGKAPIHRIILSLILPSSSSWKEWKSFSDADLSILKFLRFSYHQGKAKAKNMAVNYIQEKYSVQPESTYMIFMDTPGIVTSNWLLPLTITMNKYEKALVYPSLDVLVPQVSESGDSVTFQVSRADDMVAAFSWNFIPKWEPVNDEKRVKHVPTSKSAMEWVSPSIPSVFAVSWNYFHFLDRFDEVLLDSSIYIQENIDLSIRSWLCEGIVLQQTCSRVAVYYDHIISSIKSDENDKKRIPLGSRGITERVIDQNVINLAIRYLSFSIPEKFFDKMKAAPPSNLPESLVSDYISILHKLYQEKKLRDLSYQQRFITRIDNPLLLHSSSIDPVRTGPYQSFAHLPAPTSSVVCNDFLWFIEEIYPGMIDDGIQVIQDYFVFHSDGIHYQNLVKNLIQPYIDNFKKVYHEKYLQKIVVESSTAEGEAMKKALQDREHQFYDLGIKFILNAKDRPVPDSLKQRFDPPPYIKKFNGRTYEEIVDAVMTKNREELACIDFVDPTKENFCDKMTLSGDPTACQQHKPKVLFMCPKLCGFCDRDQDNKFCEDFYLMKCK